MLEFECPGHNPTLDARFHLFPFLCDRYAHKSYEKDNKTMTHQIAKQRTPTEGRSDIYIYIYIYISRCAARITRHRAISLRTASLAFLFATLFSRHVVKKCWKQECKKRPVRNGFSRLLDVRIMIFVIWDAPGSLFFQRLRARTRHPKWMLKWSLGHPKSQKSWFWHSKV